MIASHHIGKVRCISKHQNVSSLYVRQVNGEVLWKSFATRLYSTMPSVSNSHSNEMPWLALALVLHCFHLSFDFVLRFAWSGKRRALHCFYAMILFLFQAGFTNCDILFSILALLPLFLWMVLVSRM